MFVKKTFFMFSLPFSLTFARWDDFRAFAERDSIPRASGRIHARTMETDNRLSTKDDFIGVASCVANYREYYQHTRGIAPRCAVPRCTMPRYATPHRLASRWIIETALLSSNAPAIEAEAMYSHEILPLAGNIVRTYHGLWIRKKTWKHRQEETRINDTCAN